MIFRVELHCHTIYSKDSLADLDRLLASCRRKQIHRLVIADHNTITGAKRAQKIDPERVIIGEEIMTQGGELLAVFVQEEVPPGLSPTETIRRLRDQGAFISVSHPFDRLRKGHWELTTLVEIIPLIDAIETFNARNMWPGSNKQAQDFAEQHMLLGTVGSDAHTIFEVGKATQLLPPFDDARSLKISLSQAQNEVASSGIWIHITSRYAVWFKKLSSLLKT